MQKLKQKLAALLIISCAGLINPSALRAEGARAEGGGNYLNEAALDLISCQGDMAECLGQRDECEINLSACDLYIQDLEGVGTANEELIKEQARQIEAMEEESSSFDLTGWLTPLAIGLAAGLAGSQLLR